MSIKCNIELLSRKHFCPGRSINITYSVRVSVALVIQHAKCVLLFSPMGCPALPIFFHIIS